MERFVWFNWGRNFHKNLSNVKNLMGLNVGSLRIAEIVIGVKSLNV